MSTPSQIPLWGQAWELTVTYATATGSEDVVIGSSTWEPEALRIAFETTQSVVGSPYWYADIDIYNLTDATMQNTVLNATWVVLKAGFQSGPNFYSTIWDGPVFQVLYDREQVVDQKVTLHCVANPVGNGSQPLADMLAFAVGPFSSQNDIVARMVQETGLPPITPGQGTQSQTASDLMAAKKYPRGRGIFGRASKFLSILATDNNLTTYQDGRQANITDINNSDLTPAVVYAPAPAYAGSQTSPIPQGVTASIIGTPKQTLFGVTLTVLLDPRIKVRIPQMVIEIDRSTFIQQLPQTPGPSSTPASPFTSDLRFLVTQVTHVGDSRGNTWETRIDGFTTTYAASVGQGMFAPNSLGGATR